MVGGGETTTFREGTGVPKSVQAGSDEEGSED